MFNAKKSVGAYREEMDAMMEEEEPIYLLNEMNNRADDDDDDENPYVDEDAARSEKAADGGDLDDEDQLHDVDDNKLYLSILVKSGQLACSYFDLNQKCIHFLNDSQENSKYELANLIIDDLRPRTIITNGKCEKNFLKYLLLKVKSLREGGEGSVNVDDTEIDLDDETYIENLTNDLDDLMDENQEEDLDNESLTDADADELNDANQEARGNKRADDSDAKNAKTKIKSKISILILPSNEFNYESSRDRIINMNTIEGMPENMNGSDRFLYFNSVLNFENRLMIGSIGGLLNLLDRYKMNQSYELAEDGDMDVAAVYQFKQIKINRLLLIDSNSFKALQIFNDADYKYAFRQLFRSDPASRAKSCLPNNENISLYGHYLSKVNTKSGASKMRSWFMKPTRDLDVLSERHRMIDFLIQNRHNDSIRALTLCLKRCKYISPILKRMRVSKISFGDWKRVMNTTQSLLKVFNLIKIISNRFGGIDDSSNMNDPKELNRNHKSSTCVSMNISLLNPDPNGHRSANLTVSSIGDDEVPANESRKPRPSHGLDMLTKIDSAKFGFKFEYLANLFEKIVNVKESNVEKKIKINSSVSTELNEKLATWAKLNELLARVGQQQMEKLGINECSAIFLPHYGFLISIKEVIVKRATVAISYTSFSSDLDSMIDEALFQRMRSKFEADNELKFTFKSNDVFYYKNECMAELDAKYGNLIWEINDLEAKIVDELQKEFIKCSYYYSNALDYCGEMECLIAFANVALENDYVKPHFNFAEYTKDQKTITSSFVYAKKSRHPLMELIADENQFVPNDICIGECAGGETFSGHHLNLDSIATDKIKVLTGPNASGKTVYLKQVGILVYMAMIGSYVPAAEFICGDFDRIFTRINSNESISLRMSTFSIDIQQVADAINGSTYKSLVLLDEFGKGTQAEDGQALLAAVIRHWLRKAPHELPHVFIATHFYEMFQNELADYLFEQNKRRLEFLTFEFMQDDGVKEGDGEKFKRSLFFLYKLRRGLAESSYAINIAKKVGLPDDIINRSIEIYKLISDNILSNGSQRIGTLETEYTETLFEK